MGQRQIRELYQENRTLVWLCVVIFVNQLGFGSIVPVVPLYAREFGVSQSAIGLTIGIYGLARLLSAIPTGQLADRLGRRWVLVLGESLTAVGNLLCGLAGSFEQFLLFRFISGAGAAMVLIAGQVILADLSTRANRGRVMGAYQGVFMFGVGIGPLPGGLLAERFGLHVPFFAFAALGVLAGIVAFDRVPETRGLKGRRETAADPGPPLRPPPLATQLRILFSRLGFLLVSLVTFVQTFARTGAVFAVVPVLGAVKLGMGPDQIGLGLTLVSVVNLGMVYCSGVLVDRFGRKPVIVPAALMSATAMACFVVAPTSGWFVASLAFWGLASGINGPAPAAYAADMAPPGMNALTMSSYRGISEIGYTVGPLLLGWIADRFTSETALLTTSAMFVMASGLFALFAPEIEMAKGRRGQPAGSKQPGP